MKRLLDNLILIAGGILTGGVIWLVSSPPRGAPVELRPPPAQPPVVVHVAGAVAAPGVYELPAGSRIRDALEAAGGLLPDADPDALNQAAVLGDGQQVVVPTAAAAPAEGSAGSPGSAGQPSPAGALIDINTASFALLESLPGIGPTIAQRIIDYREANGPFAKTADIVNVAGIGPATYDKIKDLITVGP